MNRKRFCFFTSEIASLLGENPYKDKDDEIANVVQRHITGKSTYKPFIIPEEHEELISSLIDSKTSSHIGTTIEGLSATDKEIDDMKRKVYTERGTRDEVHAIDAYQTEHNVIIERPTHFMKKHYIKNNTEFFIGGKIDGMITTKNEITVIEVKNRQSRLFNVIPGYERVQIECYMRILNCKKCIFIQRFEGHNSVEEYTRDDVLWDKIACGLASIVNDNPGE
jgi:hypothetical protein